jgi:hypothetical protein
MRGKGSTDVEISQNSTSAKKIALRYEDYEESRVYQTMWT